MKNNQISVSALINAPVEQVWDKWNNPEHIVQWNAADPSWHCPKSENDLRVGGTFKNRMEAKDGSFGFDFEGVYDVVDMHKQISYTMGDGRQATTTFTPQGKGTLIETTFDAENENDVEMQKQGWQAILNSFVKYLEL